MKMSVSLKLYKNPDASFERENTRYYIPRHEELLLIG
jgi:hypothetical protein